MTTKHGWPLKIGTFRLSPTVEAPIGPSDFVTKPMDRLEALYESSTHAPSVPATAGFIHQYTIYIYNDGNWMVQWEADAEPDYPEQFDTKAEAIKYARTLVRTKGKANPRRWPTGDIRVWESLEKMRERESWPWAFFGSDGKVYAEPPEHVSFRSRRVPPDELKKLLKKANPRRRKKFREPEYVNFPGQIFAREEGLMKRLGYSYPQKVGAWKLGGEYDGGRGYRAVYMLPWHEGGWPKAELEYRPDEDSFQLTVKGAQSMGRLRILDGKVFSSQDGAFKAMRRAATKLKSNPRRRKNSGHTRSPYHRVLLDRGMKYTGSVPVTHPGGIKVPHYSYRLGSTDFYVSTHTPPGRKEVWEGSVSGSGRMYRGRGVEDLDRYLKGAVYRHRNRYPGKRRRQR